MSVQLDSSKESVLTATMHSSSGVKSKSAHSQIVQHKPPVEQRPVVESSPGELSLNTTLWFIVCGLLLAVTGISFSFGWFLAPLQFCATIAALIGSGVAFIAGSMSWPQGASPSDYDYEQSNDWEPVQKTLNSALWFVFGGICLGGAMVGIAAHAVTIMAVCLGSALVSCVTGYGIWEV
jgi:uncharacterized membrane protein YccF (DUF307 family)